MQRSLKIFVTVKGNAQKQIHFGLSKVQNFQYNNVLFLIKFSIFYELPYGLHLIFLMKSV